MRQPPSNWPSERMFSPHSISPEIHPVLLEEILFTGREEDREIVSDLIEKGEIHPHLVLKTITPDLKVRGESLHPLSGSFYENRPQCGLFAERNIAHEVDLGEYVGELQVFSDVSAINYTEDDFTWLLKNGPFVFELSARKWANEIPFANDYRGLAPEPNVSADIAIHRGCYHLMYRSIKPILSGEEVLVNYGESYWSVESRRSLLPK